MSTSEEAINRLVELANSTTNAMDLRIAAVEGLGFAEGPMARSILIGIATRTTNALNLRAAARALGNAVD